jgi:acyl-CoA thioesterase-2
VSSSHPRIDAVKLGHTTYGDVFIGASLDHAIWFHRPAPADEWQLHEFRSHGLNGGRGLSIGEVFAADGTHVATVAQEALLRERTR